METALAISSLRNDKDLPNRYKDHPLHKSSIDEETPTVVVEQDSSSEDEEERVRAEPNPDTYKPYLPLYPSIHGLIFKLVSLDFVLTRHRVYSTTIRISFRQDPTA